MIVIAVIVFLLGLLLFIVGSVMVYNHYMNREIKVKINELLICEKTSRLNLAVIIAKSAGYYIYWDKTKQCWDIPTIPVFDVINVRNSFTYLLGKWFGLTCRTWSDMGMFSIRDNSQTIWYKLLKVSTNYRGEVTLKKENCSKGKYRNLNKDTKVKKATSLKY